MTKLANCIGALALTALGGVACADDTYYIQDGAFAKIGGISATGIFETSGTGTDTVIGFDITLHEGNQTATLCSSSAFGCKVNDFLPYQSGIVDTGSKLLCTSSCQLYDDEVGLAPSGFVFAGSNAFQGASEQYRLNGYGNTTNAAAPKGSFVLAALKPTSAPELDPASAASGMTLLLGALAVLFSRRRKTIPA